MTNAELAAREQKDQRRYFRRAGWRCQVRVYNVPIDEEPPIPRPGDIFPCKTGEEEAWRIEPGGARVGPEIVKGALTMIRMTLVGTVPILDASGDTETFTYGY